MNILHRQSFSLGRRGVSVTAVSVRASEPGPTVLVTANVHGDECTGVGAGIELIRLLPTRLLSGSVVVFPSLNPEGLERRSRRLPEEDADLNRVFPGDDRGSPVDRYAAMLWSILVRLKPDVLVDLHADAPLSVPYLLLDRAVGVVGRDQLERECVRLGRASGLRVVWEYPDDRYVRFRLDRSLSGAALTKLRIPAMTIECGPRIYLDPGAMGQACRGVIGLLGELGMVEGPCEAAHEAGLGWRREGGPKNNLSGVMVPVVRPGALVRRGEDMAEIWNLAGERLERVRAEEDCMVLSFLERTFVVAGTTLTTIAVRE